MEIGPTGFVQTTDSVFGLEANGKKKNQKRN